MPAARPHRRTVLALTGGGLLLGAAGVRAAGLGDLTGLYDSLLQARRAAPDQGGPQARDRARVAAREGLAQLKRFDGKDLSVEDRLGLEAVRFAYASEADARERFRFGVIGGRMSPWVVTHLTGAWLGVEAAAAKGDAAATRDLVALLDGETARIAADAAQGVVAPAFLIDRTLEKLNAAAAGAGPAAEAVGRQIAALKALRPNASEAPGVWRLKAGDAWFERAFQDQTSSTLSVDEARRRARAEAAALSADADALLGARGLTQGSVAERLRALSRDPSLLYPDSDAGRDRAVADMTARVAALRPRLQGVIDGISAGAVAVRRMSPSDEARARAGYREPPSWDGARPGAYFVDLSRIRDRPSWTLPTVAFHETLPGHLLQLPIQEHAGLHPLRIAVGSHAYSEGWAVYAEQLADELGLYTDDPLSRLGYLQSRLFRVARMLADIGLNRDRWSLEQATTAIAEMTGEAPEAVRADAERYCVWPGQICSYAAGRWAFADLRLMARRRPGYTAAAFHDAMLRHGPLPAPVLRGALHAAIPSRRWFFQ